MSNHDKMISAIFAIALAVTVGFSLSAVEAARLTAENEIAAARADADLYAAQLRDVMQRDMIPDGMQVEYAGAFMCTAYCSRSGSISKSHDLRAVGRY